MASKEIEVKVEMKELDAAIEKATRLKEILEEIHKLIESLKGNGDRI